MYYLAMKNSLRIVGTNQKHGQDYNRSVVLENIRMFGPISRAEISEKTLLVPQTVSNLVKDLIEEQLVIELELKRSEPGRRGVTPTMLKVNANAIMAIGIQVQYSTIWGALVNLNGDILYREKIEWHLERESPYFHDILINLVKALQEVAESYPESPNVIGVGVGLPLMYQLNKNGLLKMPNINDRENFKQYLESFLKMDVFIGNNANFAAIGESWMGRGHKFHSFLYVYLGDNVGGGLIVEGNEYNGSSGRSIELGHTQYIPDGYECYCGGNGCLDQYGSLNAIRRQLGLSDEVSLENILKTADSDEQVYKVLDLATSALSDTIVSALALLDVPAVVIGGPHAKQLYDLIELKLKMRLRQRCFNSEVVLSEFNIDAGAIGAASNVFHDVLWCKPKNLLKGD